MSRDLKDRLSVLEELRPPLSVDARIGDVEAKLEAGRMHSRKGSLVTATFALAAVLLLATAFYHLTEDHGVRRVQTASPSSSRRAATTPAPNNNGFEGPVLPGGAPFVGAEKFANVSDASARSSVNISAIPRPADQLASDAQVSDVWVSTALGQPQVRIDYSSGIYVEIERASEKLKTPAGAKAVYAAMAAEDAQSTNGAAAVITIGAAAVITIGSTPAYLIPADAAVLANGTSQHAPGAVQFVVGSWWIEVVGNYQSQDLIQVSESTPKA